MKCASALMALALMLSGCGEGFDLDQSVSEMTTKSGLEIPPAVSAVVPVLGSGWDSTASRFKIDCVQGPTVQVPPDSSGRVQVRVRMTSEAIMHEMGFDMSAKARYGMFSGSLKGSLAMATAANGLSKFWVYSTMVVDRVDKMSTKPKDVTLTIPGESATEQGKWREICGDEVVYQAQRGGVFYLVYRLDFDSEESKNAVAAQVSAKVMVGEVNAGLKSLGGMLSQHTSLTIEAYQFGGEPGKLSSIVSGLNASADARESAARTLMECSNLNLEQCDLFIRRAIDYASNQEDPRAFPQQVSRTPGTITYVTAPWNSFNLGKDIRPMSSEIVDHSRNQLSTAFDWAKNYKTRVDTIASAKWSTPVQVNLAIAKRSEVNSYIAEISDAVIKCYDRLSWDPDRPDTFVEGGVLSCKRAAEAIEERRKDFLRIPDELEQSPYDRIMMQTWRQLNGMTGNDPTINQVQVGQARCGVTGETAICVYPGALGFSAYLMPAKALDRWKVPEMFERIGYPTESVKPFADRHRQTTMFTTFERGVLMLKTSGVVVMETTEHFEQYKELVRKYPNG